MDSENVVPISMASTNDDTLVLVHMVDIQIPSIPSSIPMVHNVVVVKP